MNLRYKALPDHLGVLAANIGILDAFTTGDRSMRKGEAGDFLFPDSRVAAFFNRDNGGTSRRDYVTPGTLNLRPSLSL